MIRMAVVHCRSRSSKRRSPGPLPGGSFASRAVGLVRRVVAALRAAERSLPCSEGGQTAGEECAPVAVEPQPDPVAEVCGEHAVVDALPWAIIVTTPDGRIQRWNRSAELLYGWSAPEVVGRSILDVLVPLDERPLSERVLDELRDGQPWSGDVTVLRRDGEPVRVWVTDRPLLDAQGEVEAIVGASEDVAEARLLAQRAADLTDHLRLALDAGGLGTFRWDRTTGSVEWDARHEAIYGLEPGAFAGTFDAWMALVHPDDVERLVEGLTAPGAPGGKRRVEH